MSPEEFDDYLARLENEPHVTREVVYESSGINRADRRRAHKLGQYAPKASNRPAVRQEDGSYAPLAD